MTIIVLVLTWFVMVQVMHLLPDAKEPGELSWPQWWVMFAASMFMLWLGGQ